MPSQHPLVNGEHDLVDTQHDNDQIYQVTNTTEFESLLTSLVHPLSAGNEPGHEWQITSTILITGRYPWNSFSLQQFMTSISECDKLTAFQAITDHFLTLL